MVIHFTKITDKNGNEKEPRRNMAYDVVKAYDYWFDWDRIQIGYSLYLESTNTFWGYDFHTSNIQSYTNNGDHDNVIETQNTLYYFDVVEGDELE